VNPRQVEVSYTYCFSGDLGAGTYDRSRWLNDPDTMPKALADPHHWQVAVSQVLPPVPGLVFKTLTEAVAAWNQKPAGTSGVIAVLDNHSYRESLTGNASILIPEGSRLLLIAADWPAVRHSQTPESTSLDANGLRTHLIGNVSVAGKAPGGSTSPGELHVDGFLLEGALTVTEGNLGSLQLSHSTISPSDKLSANSAGTLETNNSQLSVRMYRTICGPTFLHTDIPSFIATDCILTSGTKIALNAPAISALGAEMHLATTTLLGTSQAAILFATDCLFAGFAKAERRQQGCVRFSYVASGSLTPRRYYCQPDLAVKNVPDPAERVAIRARLVPQFTTQNFGQPAFGQLSARCATEITTGAENGAEMGAFNFLMQPQRRENLLTALDEYLRFGLEAGVIETT
jgi:hypothetical protein